VGEHREEPLARVYDRDLLLHGAKRNAILSLSEVQQYGIDSFSDPDYLRIYGMSPTQWYARGIRLLGRTAVECTRDSLGDRIGRDVASVAALMSPQAEFVVIDPFAGSCNTLYWILRHVPNSSGLAFELDPQVFELSKRNIAELDRSIALSKGDYKTLLDGLALRPECAIIVFVAPPWGTALDEEEGLDLTRTAPPISEIIGIFTQRYPAHRMLFAAQVYEKVTAGSMTEIHTMLRWSDLRVYNLNVQGRNHGVLLGTVGWKP
jgi:predicted RNA methylase